MIELPDVKANLIYADPAWTQKKWSNKGDEGRPQHYGRMSIKELCDLPVEDCAAKDCHLFMWTTGPHLQQAFKVMNAWGFKYSGMGFVWIKLNKRARSPFVIRDINLVALEDLFMGGGYTTRKNAEFCLLGRKGSPKRLAKDVHEVIISARREHSRKPDEAYDRIERYASGPYLELFARTQRKGWLSWGNETEKFNED